MTTPVMDAFAGRHHQGRVEAYALASVDAESAAGDLATEGGLLNGSDPDLLDMVVKRHRDIALVVC